MLCRRHAPARPLWLWLMSGLLAGLVSHPAAAQTAPSPSQVDTARQRAPSPLPPLAPFDLRLQAPEKSPVTRAIDEIDFDIKAVRVVGSSAFASTELEALFAPLIGRPATLSDLHRVAESIEARYRASDYFLTRVFIPPQRVKDGVFEVRVIEGRIGAVFIEGGTEAQRARLETLLSGLPQERPIRLQTLEKALLMIEEMPGLDGRGLLRAGAEPGESDLVVSLAAQPDGLSLGAGNTASNISGPWALAAQGVVNQPGGLEGQLLASVSASPDFERSKSISARYARAVGQAGTTASLGALLAQGKPGGVLSVLEGETTSVSINPRLRQTLLRSRSHGLHLDLALSVNRARTRYLDVLTSDDRTAVAELGASWQGVTPEGTTQANLSFFRGTGLAGAMGADARLPSVAGFKPHFQKWTYTFTRLQQLPERMSVMFSLQTQRSRDVLLSGEMAAFGGGYIGRGYDPAAISGDSGVGGVLEARRDWTLQAGDKTVLMQPYVFIDAAFADSSATHLRQRLRSSGAGLRASAAAGASVDLMLSRAHIDVGSLDPKANPRLVFNGSLRF